MQFCVNYRKTNELIKKDKFPCQKLIPVDTYMVVNTLALAACTGAIGRQKSMKGTVTKLPLSHGRSNGILKC